MKTWFWSQGLSICSGLLLSPSGSPGGLRLEGPGGPTGCKTRAGVGTPSPQTAAARDPLCLAGRGPPNSARSCPQHNRRGRRHRRRANSRGTPRSGRRRHHKRAGAHARGRRCAGPRSSRRGLGRSLRSGDPRSRGRAPRSRLGHRSLSMDTHPGRWSGRSHGRYTLGARGQNPGGPGRSGSRGWSSRLGESSPPPGNPGRDPGAGAAAPGAAGWPGARRARWGRLACVFVCASARGPGGGHVCSGCARRGAGSAPLCLFPDVGGTLARSGNVP